MTQLRCDSIKLRGMTADQGGKKKKCCDVNQVTFTQIDWDINGGQSEGGQQLLPSVKHQGIQENFPFN